MTQYARITPQIELSDTADFAENDLPEAEAESFTALGSYHREDIVVDVGPSGNTGIVFGGWHSGVTYGSVTDYVPFVARITNTGSKYFWVVWVPADDGSATSLGSQYADVLPGKSVIIHGRCSPNQYNNSGYLGSISLQTPAGLPAGTATVTALQLDAATIIAELS